MIPFDGSQTIEQMNGSLVDDKSFYGSYDYDDRGPGLDDRASHVQIDTTYKLPSATGVPDIRYASEIEPVGHFEDMDFTMNPDLNISEGATPVSTILTTPVRTAQPYIQVSADPSVRKALASAIANKRAAENEDEDYHTDSQDDDDAAKLLQNLKSRGFDVQRNATPYPETPPSNPPTSSHPNQPQSTSICSTCSKTFHLPSLLKYVKPTSHPNRTCPPNLIPQETRGSSFATVRVYLPSLQQILWQQGRMASSHELSTPPLLVLEMHSSQYKHQQYPTTRRICMQSRLLPPRRI